MHLKLILAHTWMFRLNYSKILKYNSESHSMFFLKLFHVFKWWSAGLIIWSKQFMFPLSLVVVLGSPACPSLMCSFNRGNIEGTNSSNICVWCLCMYVLCLRSDWFCRLSWQRVDIYTCEESLEMCICLWPEFDCPEVTLCGWQDNKTQLLLLPKRWGGGGGRDSIIALHPGPLRNLVWLGGVEGRVHVCVHGSRFCLDHNILSC